MFEKLKERIEESRQDGILRRWHEKRQRECEGCPCSWEESSYEGECIDCGCMLYREYDCRHRLCLLPDFILHAVAGHIQKKNDAAAARQYEGIGEWYMEEQERDRLFRQALYEKMFVDADGHPRDPMRLGSDGRLYPYEPQDAWGLARMDYENHMSNGMPKAKAFQKAIAEHLAPELWYEQDGRRDTFRIFTNSGAAMDRYDGLLEAAGIGQKGE